MTNARRCSVCSETGHNARTCGKEKKPAKVKAAPYVEPAPRKLEVGKIVVFYPYKGVEIHGMIKEIVSERDIAVTHYKVEWFNAEDAGVGAALTGVLSSTTYDSSWRMI
jgi:hypothetical protein